VARAWIVDRWVKDALVDGRRLKAPASQLRKLSTLAPEYRTDRFQQGKRWQLTWYETSPEGRKRLRKRSYTRRADADAARAALEDDTRSGRYVRPEDAHRPFRDAAEGWISSRQRAQPQTVDKYRHTLGTIVLPKWGRTPLDQITGQAVETWISDMRAGKHPVQLKPYKAGKPRPVRPVAASRLRSIVSVVFGGSLRWAVAQHWITTTPVGHVELPKAIPPEKEALTAKEVEEVANEAYILGGSSTGERDRALVLTLAYSGIRISEACALRVQDVDLDAHRIRVRKNFTTFSDGHTAEVEPKHYERRDIELPASVVELLRPLVADRSPDERVFRPHRGGVRLYPENVRSRIITPAASGLEVHVTPHTFRHTAASLAIAAGADVLVVQRMLGHKDATVTLNTYGHLFPDRLGEVAQALDKVRAAATSSSPNHPQSGDSRPTEGPASV
jgi:integrase